MCNTELGSAAHRCIVRRDVVPTEPCGAPAQRDHTLDCLDHQVRHLPRRQRTEMQSLLGGVPDNRQPWPWGVDVELDVAVLICPCASSIEAREQPGNESLFDDFGGDRVGKRQVLHCLCLA